MALTAKQKEGVQKVKDDLDKLEVRKARRKAGALFPSEVKDFEKRLAFDYGAVFGYTEAMIDLATEAQAAELKKQFEKYVDKCEK